jgi:hypothetical protein
VKAKIALLKMREETSMCLELSFRKARSTVLLAVETCSKGIFRLVFGHGKSPCFSRCCFSAGVGVACAVSVFASVDVGEFLDCAF